MMSFQKASKNRDCNSTLFAVGGNKGGKYGGNDGGNKGGKYGGINARFVSIAETLAKVFN